MIHVLHLGLSYACNMRCAHCFVHRDQGSIAADEARRILDELYGRGLFMVYYTFGEPLLVPYLDEVLLHGKRLGLVQVLMTNGYYLTPERAASLKESGLTNVCVSLDSPDPSRHDRNRGLEGAFSRALSAVSSAAAAGLRTGIGCTVTEKNQAELEALERLARSLGASYVSFLRERRGGVLEQGHDDRYRRFAMDYFLHPGAHCPLLFHDVTLNPALLEAHREGRISAEHYEKFSAMNSCHCGCTLCIEPNGTVSRCNLAPRAIGNIRRETLDGILSEERIGCADFACYPQFSEAGDGIPGPAVP